VKPTTSPTIFECVDSSAIFRWSNNRARDCVWVAAHPQSCSYEIAQIYCPFTCGTCPKPSSQPTNAPSKPSIVSFQPTVYPTASMTYYPTSAPTMSLSMRTNSPTKYLSFKTNSPTKYLSMRTDERKVARMIDEENFFY
jgi:hypothetical protein